MAYFNCGRELLFFFDLIKSFITFLGLRCRLWGVSLVNQPGSRGGSERPAIGSCPVDIDLT